MVPHKILKRRFRIQARGIVYLVLTLSVGLASTVRGNNLFFAIFATLVGIFVAATWLSIATLKRIEIRRIIPERVASHRAFPVELRILNLKRIFPVFAARIEDQIQQDGRLSAMQPPAVVVPLCGPRRFVKALSRVTALQRGWLEFGPLTVTCEFPPGLVSYQVTLDAPDKVLAHPREGIVSSRVLAPLIARAAADGSDTGFPLDGHDDPAGLREYRPGDNPRWIHWKTSARLPGRLYMREFEDSAGRAATILLDTHLPNHLDQRRRSRLERSYSFAVALTEALLVENYRVRIKMASPDPVDIPLDTRTGTVGPLQEALAKLKPSRTHRVEDIAGDGREQDLCFVLMAGDETPALAGPAHRRVMIHATEMRQFMYYTS